MKSFFGDKSGNDMSSPRDSTNMSSPRQKMSKREVMTLKKKVEKFIPSIRAESKSYAKQQTMQKKSLQQFSKEAIIAKPKTPTALKTIAKTAPVNKITEAKTEKY